MNENELLCPMVDDLPDAFVLTGTGTDVGKTRTAIFFLADNTSRAYWKPIQAGTVGETDSENIAVLSPATKVLPESYRLSRPLSPHLAARYDGISIDRRRIGDDFRRHQADHPVLLIEGAGGLLVPIDEKGTTMLDLFVDFALPVIIVARTVLGTINHTLLSLEALRNRSLRISGIVFFGRPNPDNEAAITTFGKIRCLGTIEERKDDFTQEGSLP